MVNNLASTFPETITIIKCGVHKFSLGLLVILFHNYPVKQTITCINGFATHVSYGYVQTHPFYQRIGSAAMNI